VPLGFYGHSVGVAKIRWMPFKTAASSQQLMSSTGKPISVPGLWRVGKGARKAIRRVYFSTFNLLF
jgi:hypothetical protein